MQALGQGIRSPLVKKVHISGGCEGGLKLELNLPRAYQDRYYRHLMAVITAALGMDHLDYSSHDIRHIVYPLLDHKGENAVQFF